MGKKSKLKTFLSKLGKKRLGQNEDPHSNGNDESYEKDSEILSSVDRIPNENTESDNLSEEDPTDTCEEETTLSLALALQGCFIDGQTQDYLAQAGDRTTAEVDDIPYIDEADLLASDISLDSQDPENFSRFFHMHNGELYYDENMPVENSPRNRRPLIIPHSEDNKLLAARLSRHQKDAAEGDESKENGGDNHWRFPNGISFSEARRRQLLTHSGKTPDECSAARIGKFTSFPQNGNLPRPKPINPKMFVKNMELPPGPNSSRRGSVEKDDRSKAATKDDNKPKKSKSNKQLVNMIESQKQRSVRESSSGQMDGSMGVEKTGTDTDDTLISRTLHTKSANGHQIKLHNTEHVILENVDNKANKILSNVQQKIRSDFKLQNNMDGINPAKKELASGSGVLQKPNHMSDKAGPNGKGSKIPRKKSSKLETGSNLSSESDEKLTKKKRKTVKSDLLSPSQESMNDDTTTADNKSMDAASLDIGPPLATSTGQKKKSSGKSSTPGQHTSGVNSGDKKKRRKDEHPHADDMTRKSIENPDLKGNQLDNPLEGMEVSYSTPKEICTSVIKTSNALAVVEPHQQTDTKEVDKPPLARTRRRRRNKEDSLIETSNPVSPSVNANSACTTNDCNIDSSAENPSDSKNTAASIMDNSGEQGFSTAQPPASRNVITPIIHYHLTIQNCDGININVNSNDPGIGPVPGNIEVNGQGQHRQQLDWTETIDSSIPFGPLVQSSESWSETSTNSTIIAGHGDYEQDQQIKELSSETNTTILATTEVNFDDTCTVSDVTCDTTYLVDADAWGCVNESSEHFSVCGHDNRNKRASTKSLEVTKLNGKSPAETLNQSGKNMVSKSVPYKLNKFSNKASGNTSPATKPKDFTPPWRSQSTTSTSSNSSSTCDENSKENVNNVQKEKNKSSGSLGEKLKSVLSRSKSKESSESKQKANKDSKQSAHSRLFHNLLNPSKNQKEHGGSIKGKRPDDNVKSQITGAQQGVDISKQGTNDAHDQATAQPRSYSACNTQLSEKSKPSKKLSNRVDEEGINSNSMGSPPSSSLFDNCTSIQAGASIPLASATNKATDPSNVPVDSAQCVKPKTQQQATTSHRPIFMPHSGNQSPKPVAKVMPMTRTTDETGRTVAGSRTLLHGYQFRFAGGSTTTTAGVTAPVSVSGVTVQSSTTSAASAFSSYITPSSSANIPQSSIATIATSSTTVSMEITQPQYSAYSSTTYSSTNTNIGPGNYLASTSRQTPQATSTYASSGASSYTQYNNNTAAISSGRSMPMASAWSPTERVESSPFSRLDARRRTTRTSSDSSPHVIISSSSSRPRTRPRNSTRSSSRMSHASPMSETPTSFSRPTSSHLRTSPTTDVYIGGRHSRTETMYNLPDTDDEVGNNTESTIALLETPANFVDVDEDLDAPSTTFTRYGLGSTIQPTMIRRRGGNRERGGNRPLTVEERVSSLRDTIVRVPGVLILSTRRNRMVVYLSQDRPNVDGVFQFMQQHGVGRSDYEVEVLPWGHRGSIAT